jgi:hypothetical protein
MLCDSVAFTEDVLFSSSVPPPDLMSKVDAGFNVLSLPWPIAPSVELVYVLTGPRPISVGTTNRSRQWNFSIADFGLGCGSAIRIPQ